MEQNQLDSSIKNFFTWLSNNGEISYDRMDYWSSSTGILAKKIFYNNKILGIPLAGLGLLLENFFPTAQKLFATKSRQPIGDAHFAMAFLNLYEIHGDKKYLNKAEHYLDVLIKTSCKGYSGYCWGYTFGWETGSGFYEPGTPLITITPYGFWAFKKHYEITGSEESLGVCDSVAQFAMNDLLVAEENEIMKCSTYSPIKKDKIINANSYRAALLMDAYKLTRNLKYKEDALKNIEFVISEQGNDGEWHYEAKPLDETFIDNFHTCFVIRNLYKCYLVDENKRLLESIKRGYDFYQENLFYEDGRPRHFARSKYPKMRKYEMYDYAEGIKLGILLKNDYEEAFEKSKWLAKDLIKNFQVKKGHFITRVTSFGSTHKVPYLRWPQAQIIMSLTELRKAINS